LVVQADDLQTGLPQVVAAMITSNLARRAHRSRVFIGLKSPQAQGTGLRTDSVIMTDSLATILNDAVAVKPGFLRNWRKANLRSFMVRCCVIPRVVSGGT
jgi:mRNA-degrading endonuclease toxin of MazEF toxin-antitoxin module